MQGANNLCWRTSPAGSRYRGTTTRASICWLLTAAETQTRQFPPPTKAATKPRLVHTQYGPVCVHTRETKRNHKTLNIRKAKRWN